MYIYLHITECPSNPMQKIPVQTFDIISLASSITDNLVSEAGVVKMEGMLCEAGENNMIGG
jgi:hypothetical protein